VDIGGGGLKEWFENRIGRAHNTVAAAATVLEESAEMVRTVPGRILLPILEHSSLEDDDELSEKWIALLANAATEARGPYVLPAYAGILRQLTPVHAKILDWIFEKRRGPLRRRTYDLCVARCEGGRIQSPIRTEQCGFTLRASTFLSHRRDGALIALDKRDARLCFDFI
jgi:hypothetical protein